MNTIIIRHYEPYDLQEIISLFKEAVANINIKHYSQPQIDVWTDINPDRWALSLQKILLLLRVIKTRLLALQI